MIPGSGALPPSSGPGERGPVYAWAARLCLALIVVVGIAVVGTSIRALLEGGIGYGWLVLAVLTWASGIFNLKVPGVPATLSVSEVFVFLQVLIYGGPAAALTVCGDGLLTSVVRRDRRLVRVLFNAAEPAVSVWIAWQAFGLAGGEVQFGGGATRLSAMVLPTALLCAVYYLGNSGLTALAVWWDTRRSPWQVWRDHFAWVSLNYFAGASVALLLLHDAREVSLRSLGAALPLIVMIYVAFKAWIRRAESENQHLAELNRLYLATVESLATAIDAKDFTTSSHIRRVQSLAIRLARALGVEREAEIKAIEVAALLHDVGKLAVPDYVLKKPGGLTPAEYELIKRHTVVGATILAAVDFPYPVVPIVRHHHENWDGTGYPDGLAGGRIPLGARILSVIDCYDALTSHRPYRRAMTPEAALGVVAERRGRMYDPDVVDAFVRLVPELNTDEREAAPQDTVIADIGGTPPDPADLARSAADSARVTDAPSSMPGVCDLVSSLADRLEFGQAAELLAYELRHATPASLVLIGLVDSRRQVVIVAHASGAGARRVQGLSVPMGEGLSGWVAANGGSIVNSDPALDLEDRLHDLAPHLGSALSTRLSSNGHIVGVLTLCAEGGAAFTDDHRQAVEAVSERLADALSRLLRASPGHDASAPPGSARQTGTPRSTAA